MNWYKTNQTREDYLSIGYEQRGSAERAMIEAQKVIGGGVMSFCIEHAGDLIHRMNDRITFDYNSGYSFIKAKVENLLSVLTNEYGFEKEFLENLKDNAEFYKETFDERREKANIVLIAYINEYKKLKTYNRAHELAKIISISIADLKINKAINALMELQSHLGSVKEWVRFAHEGLQFEENDLKI